MWDNFIGQQIRRCNRNFLIANIVFVGAIVLFASQFNYRSEGFGSLFLSIPLSLVAVWNFVWWNKRTKDFSRHPICKRLAHIGPIEQVVQQIETAMQTNSKNKPASVVLIDSNVFYTSFITATVLLVGCIPVGVLLGSLIGEPDGDMWGLLIGILMLFGGLIAVLLQRPLHATHIDSERATLNGASEAFLSNLSA